MKQSDWISIHDKLPCDFWEEKENVVEQVLVTVEHNDCDPLDDRQVTLLWYSHRNGFCWDASCARRYDDGLPWHVVAWMPKPEPAQ